MFLGRGESVTKAEARFVLMQGVLKHGHCLRRSHSYILASQGNNLCYTLSPSWCLRACLQTGKPSVRSKLRRTSSTLMCAAASCHLADADIDPGSADELRHGSIQRQSLLRSEAPAAGTRAVIRAELLCRPSQQHPRHAVI